MTRPRLWMCALLVGACSTTRAPSDTNPPAAAPPSTIPDAGDADASVAAPFDSGTSPEPEADASFSDASDASSDDDAGDGGNLDRCSDGFSRGVKGDPRKIATFAHAPEGVAVCPNGDVFVTVPDDAAIFRVPLDGSAPEAWATLKDRQPLGLKCHKTTLFVADFGSKNATVVSVSATTKGDAGTPLPQLEGGDTFHAMNDVAVVEGVGVYATDASNGLSGRVVLFAETGPGVFVPRIVKSNVGFPNALVFDPTNKTLNLTLTVSSKVLALPVQQGGDFGAESVAWSGTAVVDAVDGVTMDENKALYVAHYLQGFVARASDGAKLGKFDSPKSLAFRGGTLLVTAADGLHAIDLGTCGVH